ncbi:hypothetical protein [Burkholderia gladioli]|uniref:hypothetical protein n=1 Tax=Burkholderia gladioli TaxID=28095 RepID=UPI0016416199|nr:hypothetical protein [Burkholderia gladioli]
MRDKVSVSEAARRAGVSRQRLYQLIRAGRLSVEREAGSPRIDVAQLASLFDLTDEPSQPDADRVVPAVGAPPDSRAAPLQVQLSVALALLADCGQQLRDAREREVWMRARVDLIQREADARLAEADSRQQAIIAQGKAVIARYRSALETANQKLARERAKGFWSRVFGR